MSTSIETFKSIGQQIVNEYLGDQKFIELNFINSLAYPTEEARGYIQGAIRSYLSYLVTEGVIDTADHFTFKLRTREEIEIETQELLNY